MFITTEYENKTICLHHCVIYSCICIHTFNNNTNNTLDIHLLSVQHKRYLPEAFKEHYRTCKNQDADSTSGLQLDIRNLPLLEDVRNLQHDVRSL